MSISRLDAYFTFIIEIFNLNFQSLEVVSRYRDTQLQVTKICVICELQVTIYMSISRLDPYFTFNNEIFNLNFQSLEVVSRYRDTQLQVTENLCDLRNLGHSIYEYFKIGRIFYFY